MLLFLFQYVRGNFKDLSNRMYWYYLIHEIKFKSNSKIHKTYSRNFGLFIFWISLNQFFVKPYSNQKYF